MGDIVVDPEGVVWWVAEHTNLPVDLVADVLGLEEELQMALGIIDPPRGHVFEFYDPQDLEGHPLVVDLARLARDAPAFLGVDEDLAMTVLEGETAYFVMRGLIDLSARQGEHG
jgi:hypothetical protein